LKAQFLPSSSTATTANVDEGSTYTDTQLVDNSGKLNLCYSY